MDQQNSPIHLVECPRDAMQGWPHPIPTTEKIRYLNALLKVGFDTLDFGSFVSAKAIPQMADTPEVLEGLQLDGTDTKLLAIVANLRGAREAVVFDQISYLGYPFSLSPTFQLRNTNHSMLDSLRLVADIQDLCSKHQKQLVVYLSMGFGNPYGDDYSEELVLEWTDKLVQLEIGTVALSDTVGLASPALVQRVVSSVMADYPTTNIGVHLHASINNWEAKTSAALSAGCKRFDGALKGIGGCPMAGDALVGNVDTSLLIPYFQQQHLLGPINEPALSNAMAMAEKLFTT